MAEVLVVATDAAAAAYDRAKLVYSRRRRRDRDRAAGGRRAGRAAQFRRHRHRARHGASAQCRRIAHVHRPASRGGDRDGCRPRHRRCRRSRDACPGAGRGRGSDACPLGQALGLIAERFGEPGCSARGISPDRRRLGGIPVPADEGAHRPHHRLDGARGPVREPPQLLVGAASSVEESTGTIRYSGAGISIAVSAAPTAPTRLAFRSAHAAARPRSRSAVRKSRFARIPVSR